MAENEIVPTDGPEDGAVVDAESTDVEALSSDDHPDAEGTEVETEAQECEASIDVSEAEGPDLEEELSPEDVAAAEAELERLLASDVPSEVVASGALPRKQLTLTQVKTILNRLGFRTNTDSRYHQAIRDFQGGWALGAPLVVDGHTGPATLRALAISDAARRAGRGTMSQHFSYIEFACKCGGRYASCRRVWATRRLVLALEVYRKALGHRISVVSGCRCYNHNRAVGGVRSSQHLLGKACDVSYYYRWTDSRVRGLRVFTGIGRSARTHLVRHVDVRSGVSASSPTVWNYAS